MTMCLNVSNLAVIKDFCHSVDDVIISRIVIKENEKAVNMVVKSHMLPTKTSDYMKDHVNEIQTGN